MGKKRYKPPAFHPRAFLWLAALLSRQTKRVGEGFQRKERLRNQRERAKEKDEIVDVDGNLPDLVRNRMGNR